MFADAIAEPQFDLEPGVLDLVYKVNEGKQYRIGDIDIQIKGENNHTRYATVLNRMSIRPGDIADIREFRSSERRLKSSGLYNTDPSKGDLPKIVFSPPDSEEAIANSKRKRATARRTGNPDSFRGQSPDDRASRRRAPLRPCAIKAPTDYGGRAINSTAPGPQPYSVEPGAARNRCCRRSPTIRLRRTAGAALRAAGQPARCAAVCAAGGAGGSALLSAGRAAAGGLRGASGSALVRLTARRR